jgi:hypothetical protein
MAKRIALGKADLSDLGLSFIVANVPAFPIGTQKTYKMKTIEFHSKEEVVERLSSIPYLVVFDDPVIYGDKLNKEIPVDQDKYRVSCVIDLNDKDLAVIKNNLKETVTQIFSFEWDFSCFKN